MNENDAAKFFDEEVIGRFPNWKPEAALMKDWLGWIANFDYPTATQAIKNHKFESRLTYPILKAFYAKAKALRLGGPVSGRDRKSKPVLLYSLQSEENPKDVRQFFLPHAQNNIPSPDAIFWMAQRSKEEHEECYGGVWRIIRNWEDVEVKKPVDRLRGEEAKQEAYRYILSGLDTPGKRWLQQYLKRKEEKLQRKPDKWAKKTREPQRIGAILDDIPF